jgi:AcrR family transcriptional regulator
MRLFSVKGYVGTGINEIIEAVDSSKGGFYNHFSSKEELFFDVLAEAQKMWRERVLHGLDSTEGAVARLSRLLHNYRDRYLKDGDNFPGGCIFVTFSVELDHQHPQLVEEVRRGFMGLRRLLGRLLEEGKREGEFQEDLDVGAEAEMIFAGMLGASVLFGVERSPATLDKAIQSLIDHVAMLGRRTRGG